MAVPDELLDRCDPVVDPGRHDADLHVGGEAPRIRHLPFDLGWRDEVGLGQDDDRARPALPGQHELASQTRQVDAGVERLEHEDGVHVGRDRL